MCVHMCMCVHVYMVHAYISPRGLCALNTQIETVVHYAYIFNKHRFKHPAFKT